MRATIELVPLFWVAGSIVGTAVALRAERRGRRDDFPLIVARWAMLVTAALTVAVVVWEVS